MEMTQQQKNEIVNRLREEFKEEFSEEVTPIAPVSWICFGVPELILGTICDGKEYAVGIPIALENRYLLARVCRESVGTITSQNPPGNLHPYIHPSYPNTDPIGIVVEG